MFTISLTGNASLSPLTIGYTAFDGHATTAGTLTFSTADTSTQAITITAFDDHLWVPVSENESVSLTLSLPGGVGGTTSQTATIAEDSDDTPTLNVSSGCLAVRHRRDWPADAYREPLLYAPESPLTGGDTAGTANRKAGERDLQQHRHQPDVLRQRLRRAWACRTPRWLATAACRWGFRCPPGILGGTLLTIATIVELPSLSGRGRWRGRGFIMTATPTVCPPDGIISLRAGPPTTHGRLQIPSPRNKVPLAPQVS